MKKIILSICLVLVLPLAGCDKWLNVKPLNEQPMDEFWKTKEEVRSVVMGTYQQLRSCLNLMVQWGEVRSDEVDLGPGFSSNNDMLAVKSIEIKPDNGICQWRLFYNAIARCNSIIQFAPSVLKTDDTFLEKDCRNYIAEAVWMRTLCYFYLVRAFRDVPLVYDPYMEDDAVFEVAQTDGMEVLRTIASEMEDYMDDLPISYAPGSWHNTGRARIWAAYALLADIYLWLEDYDRTIEFVSKIEASKVFSLMPQKEWYKIYYPGNSDESIYELQYDYVYDQTNSLFNWFYNENSNNNYAASESLMAMFELLDDEAATPAEETMEDTDVRGAGGSFLAASGQVWKYGGTARGSGNVRGTDHRDANWIISRYADVLLMHAEALAMKGEFAGALAYVNEVRLRAGILTPLSEPVNEADALSMVMDERERELCFEGKRWFDLVRMAIRDDGKYKSRLISLMLISVPAKDRPLYQVKLQDTYGYFFPVNEDDMDASGGALVQNPYYL